MNEANPISATEWIYLDTPHQSSNASKSNCVLVGDGNVVYEGNKVVVEGDPFTIICHTDVFDVIKWQLNEQTIIPDSQNQYILEEEKNNGKVVAKLSVPQAQNSHTGSYRCTSFSNVTHQVYVFANSVQPNYDFDNYKSFDYDKSFTLQCNISGNQGNQFELRWYKEDKLIENVKDKYLIKEEENKLVVSAANEDDIGNYTCQAVNRKTPNSTDSLMRATIRVIGAPKITLAEDTPVVEGERLRLHCQVRGNPPPNVVWSIDGKAVNTSDGRIRFENDNNIANAILVIDTVQMNDRNQYTCKASNIANHESTGPEKTTFVRVKDKLAALWPFLGICAEVAILCTIILIYEKKRNKTELDESDTDQSPEQFLGVSQDPTFNNILNPTFWHKHGDHANDQVQGEEWILIPLKPEPEKKGSKSDASKGRVHSQADSFKGRVPYSESRYKTFKNAPTPSKQVRSRTLNPPKSSPIPSKSTTTRKNTPDHGKDVRQRK
ncbi:Basigin [Frankliniella fusca]|uniref:Basigin n=1 Tax=Frankliniella fusca TaxID=407009 RepID=A0AAE1I4Q5_9NEOP|nr:Basigin [Frankliniella fusca]